VSVPSGNTSNTVESPVSSAPDINQGIISRDILEQSQNDINVQPTLVIDDVDAAQNRRLANSETSVI